MTKQQAQAHRLYKVFYNTSLRFAGLITLEAGQTAEQYAEREATEKVMNIDRLCEEENNQQMVDLTTGKIVGTRRQVEQRYS